MPWFLCQAIYQAWQFLRRVKPNLVIGMGGFAAAPGGIAAKLLGIRLIIHEQNQIAGLTNRWLARLANQVLCGFPDTFKVSHKVQVTGNPVRTTVESASATATDPTMTHLRFLVCLT